MKNNTNYFSHDCNARNDERLMKIRAKFWREGYWVYFAIIEMLSEASDYKLSLDNIIVITNLYQLNNDVITMLFQCNLLVKDEHNFRSDSLLRRMELKEAKLKKYSDAWRAWMESRWKSKRKPSSDKGSNNDVITSKVKESKVKQYIVWKDEIVELLSQEEISLYKDQLYVLRKMIEYGYSIPKKKKDLLELVERVNDMAKDYLPRNEEWMLNRSIWRTYANQWQEYAKSVSIKQKWIKSSIRTSFSIYSKPKWQK